MSSQRSAGVSTVPIEIDGKTYTLRTPTCDFFPRFQDWIVQEKGDPIADVCSRSNLIPESHLHILLEAAIKVAQDNRVVTMEDIKKYSSTIRGLSWQFWQLVKQDHPEIDTLDAAQEILVKLDQAKSMELLGKMRIASGEEDAKNSSGQAAAEATPTTPPAGP